MTPDLHALISQMATELDHCQQLLRDDRRQRHPLADGARALLAEPEPEVPTDEELLRVAATAIAPYEISGITPGEYEPETECIVEAYGSELIAYARAVLARWGRPKPPSLKEQALDILEYPKDFWREDEVDTIRRALEALPE